MKTKTTLKRLEKYGKVEKNNNGQYYIFSDTHVLSFYDQGGEVVCLHVKGKEDETDSMTDYFPGFFPKSLRYAIECTFGMDA